jgi:hypothetical protein
MSGNIYDFLDPDYWADGPHDWQHLPVRKPVIRWTGLNADTIVDWAGDKAYVEAGRLLIRTPQGDLEPALGDFVVRGVEHEFYPVPASIFFASYEPVGE